MRYIVLLKNKLLSPMCYVEIALLILISYIAANIYIPFGKNDSTNIYLYCEDKESVAYDICRQLEEKNSVFRFKITDDLEKAEEYVASGRADSLFVFKDNFDKKLSQGKPINTIECKTGLYTAKAEAAKEVVNALIIKKASDFILKNNESKVFKNISKEESQKLMNYKESILESDDVFKVEFIDEKGEAKAEEKQKGIFIHLAAAFIIFLTIFSSFAENIKNTASPVIGMQPGKKMVYLITYHIANITPIFIFALGAIFIFERNYNIITEALLLLLFILHSLIFIKVFELVFGRKRLPSLSALFTVVNMAALVSGMVTYNKVFMLIEYFIPLGSYQRLLQLLG